jgi:hypothetical protein
LSSPFFPFSPSYPFTFSLIHSAPHLPELPHDGTSAARPHPAGCRALARRRLCPALPRRRRHLRPACATVLCLCPASASPNRRLRLVQGAPPGPGCSDRPCTGGKGVKGEAESDGATFSWLRLRSGSRLRLHHQLHARSRAAAPPFSRAPRGAGAGAPFGALPNRARVTKRAIFTCNYEGVKSCI